MKKGEQTRAAILDEALSLTSLIGLNGISIGNLASRLSLSKSGLFSHFGSKEALQHAVLDAVTDRFIERVIRPALAESTGIERIRTCFSLWIHWTEGLNLPGGCPLLAASLEFDDQPGPLREHIYKQQSRWQDAISRMAQKAIHDGDFRADLDATQFAFEFNAIGLGCSLSKRLLQDPEADKRAVTAFERLVNDARHTDSGPVPYSTPHRS